MKVTIFYSWQSDLPNNTNRSFIESVINKAINMINRKETYELDLCLERDTQGTPGSPNIVKTILEKISTCDIFVADISIVTGDFAKQQRPSPNPNVLIELGYAIACLGWERIILFCNEIYGTNEKLPFDIQQHRRIGYELKTDDIKGPVREQLTKTFKDGVIDITENLYASKNIKGPDLSVDWTYFKYVPSEKTRNGIAKEQIRSDVLMLPRSMPIGDVESILQKEMDDIKRIDGSIDPKWDEKVNGFVDKCDAFIKQLNSGLIKKNYLIHQNLRHAVHTTLTFANIGSSPASDARVKIKLPDWLLAFEKLPDKDRIPIRPAKPIPTSPKPPQHVFATGRIIPRPYNFNIPKLSSLYHNQTSACYVKNDTLVMWADKLLHKHDLTITDDCFYLLAMPNAELGVHKLTAHIFCVEYDNWKDIELLIKITETSK